MQRLAWLAILAALCCSGVFANVVISCSYDPNNVIPTYTQNNCVGPNFATWNETVDWRTAFGAADNVTHNVTGGTGPTVATNGWVTSFPGGVGLTISLGPNKTGGSTLNRADNTVFACGTTSSDCGYPNGNGMQFAAQLDPNITTFSGHFNSLDVNNPAVYTDFLGFGDHLLGTNGTPMNIAVASGWFLTSAGFDISTRISSDFTARIDAYDGTNYLGSYGISTSGGAGGDCASLHTLGNGGFSPPIPCNDAPFIGISGAHITNLVVYTNDTHGFYIDTLSGALQEDPLGAPEPSTVWMFCSAFGALVIARSRLARR